MGRRQRQGIPFCTLASAGFQVGYLQWKEKIYLSLYKLSGLFSQAYRILKRRLLSTGANLICLSMAWASLMVQQVKNPPANAGDTGDMGFIPGSGRSSGGGKWQPLQYSCLENPTDRKAWWPTAQRVTKSQTWPNDYEGMQVWLCTSGTNSGNILSTSEDLPEPGNHQTLSHNGTFMPGLCISILKDKTLLIYAFSFKGVSCMYGCNGSWCNLCVLVAQLCPSLCDPMDCSLPGFSVHEILQARILEWVAISFSRESSQLRDWIQVFYIAGECFTIWATREALKHFDHQQIHIWEEKQESGLTI